MNTYGGYSSRLQGSMLFMVLFNVVVIWVMYHLFPEVPPRLTNAYLIVSGLSALIYVVAAFQALWTFSRLRRWEDDNGFTAMGWWSAANLIWACSAAMALA